MQVVASLVTVYSTKLAINVSLPIIVEILHKIRIYAIRQATYIIYLVISRWALSWVEDHDMEHVSGQRLEMLTEW
jgi:hypothetical protein